MIDGETHQPAGWWRLFHHGLHPWDLLQPIPEARTALTDQSFPLLRIAQLFQQVQGAAQAGTQWNAAGRHLKAAPVVVPLAAAAVLIAQAAPADHGGLALLEHPLGERHTAETLRAAAPLVACEGIDVGRSRHTAELQAAHRLGGIHQQPGVARVLLEASGHRFDRHRKPAVPEQVGEHHQPCARLQGCFQRFEQGGITAAIAGREPGDGEALAPRQLLASGHHAGMFRIAEQQAVARFKRQSPQRQHAAAGHVFSEAEPVRRHATELGQAPPES